MVWSLNDINLILFSDTATDTDMDMVTSPAITDSDVSSKTWICLCHDFYNCHQLLSLVWSLVKSSCVIFINIYLSKINWWWLMIMFFSLNLPHPHQRLFENESHFKNVEHQHSCISVLWLGLILDLCDSKRDAVQCIVMQTLTFERMVWILDMIVLRSSKMIITTDFTL